MDLQPRICNISFPSIRAIPRRRQGRGTSAAARSHRGREAGGAAPSSSSSLSDRQLADLPPLVLHHPRLHRLHGLRALPLRGTVALPITTSTGEGRSELRDVRGGVRPATAAEPAQSHVGDERTGDRRAGRQPDGQGRLARRQASSRPGSWRHCNVLTPRGSWGKRRKFPRTLRRKSRRLDPRCCHLYRHRLQVGHGQMPLIPYDQVGCRCIDMTKIQGYNNNSSYNNCRTKLVLSTHNNHHLLPGCCPARLLL